MTVTIEYQQTGARSYLFRWSSDTSSKFWVYRNGVIVWADTPNTEMVVSLAAGEVARIEVFDTAAEAPGAVLSGYVRVHWYAGTAVDYYNIQQYSGGWTTIARREDNGESYFTWTSSFLDDVTSYTFGILPVGDNGNEGDRTSLSILVVRYPDPPDIASIEYNGAETPTITITFTQE